MTVRYAFNANRVVLIAIVGACAACGARTSLDDGTENEAPRPVSPLSTSRVTSRRPTLHWVLPLGLGDATLDLCLDRACTMRIGAPVHVEGESYAPATDLPVGVVYWRLHPRAVTAVTSATWQFTVGARSAAIDASWGTTLDVNGDGYADLVVGALDSGGVGRGRAYVYLGSARGFSTTPATTLAGPDGGFFGHSAASAGDVNGDGYADLVVGAYDVSGYFTGRAYVYLGSASGLAADPATVLEGPDGGSFGFAVASAGDVNGDGYADLVVGAYSASTGIAYLYLGSATGLVTTPAETLTVPGSDVSSFGVSVAGAGDVNGDGYADVAVGAKSVNFTARAYVYLGGASGLVTAPATTLIDPYGPGDPNSYSVASAVASAGDVNGDGYADLVFGAEGANETGNAYVYLGSASGLSSEPATTLTRFDGEGGGYPGFSVASIGDVNGDGYADLVVAGSDASSLAERAYVYLGSANGIPSAPAATLTPHEGPGGAFGYAVASAGDVNGDGYAELVIGAPFVGDAGTAFIYRGGATGLAAPPTTTLAGSNGVNGYFEYFGTSVFGASD